MKHIFVVISFLTIACTGFAQKSATTPAAEKSFREKFPNAKEAKWEKEGKDELEVSFVQDGKKGSANFSPAGEWLETEMAIPASAAPKAVIDAFNKNFPGATISELYQISSKKEKNYFEVEYLLKGKKKEAKISADGKII
jgi:hypothetical protein